MILKCLKEPGGLYVLRVKRSEITDVPYSNDGADPHWIKGCDVAALSGYESALKKEQVQDVPLLLFVFA